jgi:hypothetical protein
LRRSELAQTAAREQDPSPKAFLTKTSNSSHAIDFQNNFEAVLD